MGGGEWAGDGVGRVSAESTVHARHTGPLHIDQNMYVSHMHNHTVGQMRALA